MAELDEQIAKVSRLIKKLEFNDIKKGAFIGEEIVEFEERQFFEDKMRMWVPIQFSEMTREVAKVKYPYEQRPKLILTNAPCTVNLSLNLFDQEIDIHQVPQAVEGYRALIHKAQPANLFHEKKIEPLNQTSLGWFDFKSYALDDQLYNLMFVTGIGKKLMLGTFNCIFVNYVDWKPYALQMIRSILDLTNKIVTKKHI